MKKSKVITRVLAHTKRPSIHISPVSNGVVSCLDSRFGGCFYLPQGAQAPTHPSCGEMEFLAQINLSQLPPLEGFPQKGLLQFFLCTDENEMEEMDTGELVSDGHFKVLYYPQADNDQFVHPEQSIENRWPMETFSSGMKFEKVEETATLSLGEEGFETDLGCEDVLDLLTEDLLVKAGYDLTDCPDTDRFCVDFGNWGCKMGGHPAIRQGDVRHQNQCFADYTVLLFQLDLTPPDQLETDTFAFFIKPQDLSNCQFDDILLYWHNCY